MNLLVGFPYPLNQEVEIPLDQIVPNPEQPRIFVDKEDIEVLAASLRAKGQEVAARVRPLTEPERAAHPGAWVMLIGGHGRREAALLNQFKTLKCTVQLMTPEEAVTSAARDNSVRGMHWWEWYLIIERADKAGGKSQTAIAAELGQSQTRVNWALKITKTLNPAARAMAQENLQKSLKNDYYDAIAKNKDFSITERTLLALADLEDPNQVLKALQTVLDDYLTTDQTKKLVASMKAGNPADTYKTHLPTAAINPSAKTAKAVAASSPTPEKTTHPTQQVKAESASPNSSMGSVETAGWDLLAGISVVAQIRTKIKKGEKPTLGETLILLADLLWRALHWLSKLGWKLGKWFLKEVGRLLKMAFKGLWKELGPWVRKATAFIFGLIIFGGGFWVVWDIHEHGWMHPVHLVEAKLFSSKPTSDPRPQAEGQALSVPISPTKEMGTPAPTQVVTQHKKAQVAKAVPTVQVSPTQALVKAVATPTVKKGDVLGDVAKGTNAVDGVAKLFGL